MAFPLINPTITFFADGVPASQGTVDTLNPVDDTLLPTYPTAADADAATNANINPLTLNGNGEWTTGIFVPDGVNMKYVLKNSLGATKWTRDNVETPVATQANIGLILYPRSAAEISAGVTPVDYSKNYGHILRYGINTTPLTTDMTTALSNATLAVGDDGWVDLDGESLAISSLAFTKNVRWKSEGQATIKCSNAGAVQEGFITVTGSLITDLRGIIFDGNSKVDKLVSCINSADTGSGKYVNSIRCTFKNTDTNTKSSAGLNVEGGFDFAYTDPTTIFRGMAATGTSKVSRGFRIASSGAFVVRNAIAESFFDDVTPINDSDAIFAEAATGTMNDAHLTVTSAARFRNCAKRSIKCQMYSAYIGACHIERTQDFLNTGDPEISVQAGGALVDGPKFYYPLGAYAPGLLVQFNNTLNFSTPTAHRNPSSWVNGSVNVGDNTPINHALQLNNAEPTVGNDDCRMSNVTFNCHLTKLVSFDPNAGDAADVQIAGFLADGNYIKELSGTNHALFWGSRLAGPGNAVEMKVRARNNVVGNTTDAPGYYNAEAGTAFTSGSSVDFTIEEWENNVGVTVPEVSSGVPANIPIFTDTDATPSVKGYKTWKSFTNALTITDLDDGKAGDEITILIEGAITFDTTGTNLTGSSVDIVTAAGDVVRWLCEDGTTWRLLAYVDVSVNNSGGA